MERDQSRQGAVFINDHRFVDYPVFEQGKNFCQYKCFRNQERTVSRVHDGRFDRLAGIPVLVAEHFAHIGKTFEIIKGSVSHGKTEVGGMINILPDIFLRILQINPYKLRPRGHSIRRSEIIQRKNILNHFRFFFVNRAELRPLMEKDTYFLFRYGRFAPHADAEHLHHKLR